MSRFLLVLLAASLLGRADVAHAGATTIPEFRLGSCGNPVVPCNWDCTQLSDGNPVCMTPVCADQSEPLCADSGAPGCVGSGQLECSDSSTPSCADASIPVCQTNGDLTCELDVLETFTAHVVVTIDDEPCKTAGMGGTDIGGAVVEIGLRGTRQDGIEFTIPSRTVNLCGVNNACDGCAGICSFLDTSCPLTSAFLCEVLPADQGLPENCPLPATDTNRRFCESDLGGLGGWLSNGKQPLPPFVYDYSLLQELFPSAIDVPVVQSVEELALSEHAFDDQPSVGHYCVVFQFLTDGKYKPVPFQVANAPVSPSSLVVTGDCHCPPSPDPSCETGFDGGLLTVNETNPGKEKLVAKGLKGPALAAADLGDPLASGGTRYDLCVYDAGGALAGQYTVDRAGDTCGTDACWKNLGDPPGQPGHQGYRYRDKATAADGAMLLLLKGGDAGKSKIVAKAKNNAAQGQTALPTGTAAALSGSSGATVQLHGSDATKCVSLSLGTVVQDTGTRFKAKP